MGIVNLGSDHVVVRSNRVLGNDSLGVIVLRNSLLISDPWLNDLPSPERIVIHRRVTVLTP